MGRADSGLSSAPARVSTLVAAGAAAWEPEAVAAIAGSRRAVVLVKRCLDLTDLLASAAGGIAEVAVVSDQLPGLDADSIDRLARSGVRTVAVTSAGGARRTGGDELSARTRLLRMGAARVLDEDAVGALVEHVQDAARQEVRPLDGPDGPAAAAGEPVDPRAAVDVRSSREPGRLVAVWGATGAPGRTTLAIGVAAEAASRGSRVMLLDADPYGGAVGQHLAVLEEVSGLLAATRAANAGQLDAVRLAGLAREVVPRLRLLTGLPRPDRWTELRPPAVSEVLARARELDDVVVVDTGFGLPGGADLDPYSAVPDRDEVTLAVVEEADCVVLVASADPVGLTRLARSLRDLLEVRPQGDLVVAVNRMRSSLGWSEHQIGDLVGQVAPQARVCFVPDDRGAADRALVSGRTLVECGDSTLRRAVARLTDAVVPAVVTSGSGTRARGRVRLLRR